jgi:parvulin-like peptidyl-prolyl isomerase
MKHAVVCLALLGFAAAVLIAAEQAAPPQAAAEPEHVQVQHILISFTGKLPGKNVTRTQEEAQKLAYDVLARARKGEDFDALVKQYTDDAAPGMYGMSNAGVAPAGGEYSRTGMVPAFGDVGFKLKVGEIGIADFDARKSPFGYHIIKRIK